MITTQTAWPDNDATVFASAAWFERWFEAFGTGEHGLWESPEPTSPYRVPYLIRLCRMGPVAIRVAWGAANSYTPQFDIVGNGAPRVSDLRRMMKDLGVSALVLPLLSPTSRLASAINSVPRRADLFLDFCEAAPILDCGGTWDAYLATRRKSRRSEWFDKERRLLKAGGRMEVLSTWAEVSSIFDELLAVEASGWKGRKGTSIVQIPAARKFFDGIYGDLAAAGKLQVFLIRRGDRIIAFKLCTLHGGRLSSLKTGYLEEFAKESPGLVLQLWVAKWCFERNDIKVLDLLGPATPNKLEWSTHTEELATLYVFRRTLGGALAWLRWSVVPRARQWWRRNGGTPPGQTWAS